MGEINKKPYTTGEVASLCNVTINAVKKWIAADKIKAFRTPGGHYRINREDFLEFLARYKLDIKDALFPERQKILIVDDEPEIVDYIKGAIESMEIECEIETASDGYEALILVGQFNPALLILDLRMPKIDGFEVCRRLKQSDSTKGLKILAVTAYGREDMEKIVDCGADKCLSKPLKLKEFQAQVLRLLH
ncbi:MAG: response regulator [Proteobacteria bacterium]|nr:response regulator [Pseudomonadota bacterium]